MTDLVRHLLDPVIAHPDDVRVQLVEGEAAVVVEVVMHPSDRERLEADGARLLRAIRNVLSAAAGRRKATLDLVEADAFGASEE